jgi:hypothetical protein
MKAKVKIKLGPYPVPVKQKLVDILKTEIRKAEITGKSGVCLVFRDRSYSPEKGGFHPVEISVNSKGEILYITDFAYRGLPPMTELCRELDFDIAMQVFQVNDDCYPIDHARSIFRIWQSNFCEYYNMGVFDEIRVTENIRADEQLQENQIRSEAEIL